MLLLRLGSIRLTSILLLISLWLFSWAYSDEASWRDPHKDGLQKWSPRNGSSQYNSPWGTEVCYKLHELDWTWFLPHLSLQVRPLLHLPYKRPWNRGLRKAIPSCTIHANYKIINVCCCKPLHFGTFHSAEIGGKKREFGILK